MIFTDAEENDFLAMEKLAIREKVYVKEIKERLSRPGKMQFYMIMRNDSYRGFDKKVSVIIDVQKEVQRAPIEYDEEDIQAMKAPSMMQQMMELAPQENESDDEESEDEQSTAPTNKDANSNSASQAQEQEKASPESKKEK